ncbi:MAG TPA: hypothetical protein VMS65_00175, partial [Polyangiaceae bacterium]|nr:hypothetical protein [Polyangiaceae bacterium]
MLRSLFLGAALFSAVAACSVSSADMAAGADDGAGGTTGTGGSGAAAVTLTFDQEEPWTLAPNEKQDLKVTVTPSGPAYTVRFALLDGPMPNSVADGALNLTEATTNDLGEVVVQVTAPSVPTEFHLRAMVGTTQKKLNIIVEANGKATLVVEPMYAGGRTVTEWVAEVYEDGRTCADLKGNPPEGELPAPKHSVTVAEGEPIVIEKVTVGTPLAVALRAGYFAGGCSTLDGVVEGQPNSVAVTVTNRPIQLDQSHATLSLGLRDQEDALAGGFQSAIDAALAELLGTAASDTEALLDAMEEEATAGAVCTGNRFGNARESNGWDLELATALGATAATSIRDDFGAWLAQGVPSLAQDEAFVGEIGAVPDMTGRAELALESVAGFDAGDAGFPASVACTWTADAHDNVAFGGTVRFNPAALLVLAALEPALGDE